MILSMTISQADTKGTNMTTATENRTNKFGMTTIDAYDWQNRVVTEAIDAPMTGEDSHYAISSQVQAMINHPGAMVGFESIIYETSLMIAGVCRTKSRLAAK